LIHYALCQPCYDYANQWMLPSANPAR